MLVSIEELGKTSLYPEIITAITRNDDVAAEMHILAAEALVRSYLSKYDCEAIFDTQTYTGSSLPLIKKMVKVIASWYMVRMANPNVDIELYRQDYADAMLWLTELQKGNVNPDLPYKPDNPETPEDESGEDVFWASNLKRNNHF